MERGRRVARELDAGPQAHRPAEALGVVVETRDRRTFRLGGGSDVVPDALDRQVAPLVDERREQAGETRDRVGDRPAGHARVHRTVERAQLDVGRGEAAQRVRESRDADLPVARVREDEHVAAQLGAVRFEEREEGRRADLLLTLDQHAHVARQRARGLQPRRHRVRVRDPTRLVVGAAAAVQAAPALRRLEGCALPVLDDAGRLHVVVRVQEHGRRVRTGVHPLADDVRMRAVDRGEPDRLQPVRAEQVGGGLGAGLHVAPAVGIGADAGDPDQGLELGPGRVLPGVDGRGRVCRPRLDGREPRPSPNGLSRASTAFFTPSVRSFGMYSFDERWCRPSAWSSVVARSPVRMPCASMARCTPRLLSASRSPGTCATRSAIASTSSSSRSAGNARLANPFATASTPVIESPVSTASIARRRPMYHGCHKQVGRRHRAHRRVADHRVVGDVEEVARGGELRTAGEAVAVDLADDGCRHVHHLHPALDQRPAPEPVAQGGGPGQRLVGVGREVVAGAEARARASQDHHADVEVLVAPPQLVEQHRAHAVAHRVALLGPVERDAADVRTRIVGENDGLGHEGDATSALPRLSMRLRPPALDHACGVSGLTGPPGLRLDAKA